MAITLTDIKEFVAAIDAAQPDPPFLGEEEVMFEMIQFLLNAHGPMLEALEMARASFDKHDGLLDPNAIGAICAAIATAKEVKDAV